MKIKLSLIFRLPGSQNFSSSFSQGTIFGQVLAGRPTVSLARVESIFNDFINEKQTACKNISLIKLNLSENVNQRGTEIYLL